MTASKHEGDRDARLRYQATNKGSDDVRGRIVVGVPTHKRPEQLSELLRTLEPQVARVDGLIIVVDNDPNGSAEPITGRTSLAKYVREPKPGVANVRNRLLYEATGAQALACIDDDEIPALDWLERLLKAQQESGAEVVVGPVISHLPTDAPPWAHDQFTRPRHPTGPYAGHVAAGNCLIDMPYIESTGIAFRNDFDFHAGEDTDLFWALRTTGANVYWCDEAVATEHVDPSRLSARWVFNRARQSSAAYAMTEAQHRGTALAVMRALLRTLRLTSAFKLIVRSILHADSATASRIEAGRIAGTVLGGYLGCLKLLIRHAT